jgi:hypothetical protein
MTIARRTEMTQRITTPDARVPDAGPEATRANKSAAGLRSGRWPLFVVAEFVTLDGVVILTYEPARDGR